MKFVDYIDTQPRAIKVGGLVENQGNWTAAKLCLRATFCWFFISHVRLEKRKKKNGKAKEKKWEALATQSALSKQFRCWYVQIDLSVWNVQL